MPNDRITVRVGEQLLKKLDAYAKKHGLDRATAFRLAIAEQVKRDPPKKLPKGVERVPGNPRAAEQAKAAAEARWGKRESE